MKDRINIGLKSFSGRLTRPSAPAFTYGCLIIVGCLSLDQYVDLKAWQQNITTLQLTQSLNQQQTLGTHQVCSGSLITALNGAEQHCTTMALHEFAECLNILTARRHSFTASILRKDYILPVGILPCVDKLNARPQNCETQVPALLSTACCAGTAHFVKSHALDNICCSSFHGSHPLSLLSVSLGLTEAIVRS